MIWLAGIEDRIRETVPEGFEVHTLSVEADNGSWRVTVQATDMHDGCNLENAQWVGYADTHGGLDKLELTTGDTRACATCGKAR